MSESKKYAGFRLAHTMLRVLDLELSLKFYCDILGLNMGNREEGDENYYVSDGHMTVVLAPWDITKYANTGISRSGPDHFVFKVESIEKFKESYTAMVERNQNLTPPGVGVGPEGKARLGMLTQSAPYAKHFLSDLDNVFLGVTD